MCWTHIQVRSNQQPGKRNMRKYSYIGINFVLLLQFSSRNVELLSFFLHINSRNICASGLIFSVLITTLSVKKYGVESNLRARIRGIPFTFHMEFCSSIHSVTLSSVHAVNDVTRRFCFFSSQGKSSSHFLPKIFPAFKFDGYKNV